MHTVPGDRIRLALLLLVLAGCAQRPPELMRVHTEETRDAPRTISTKLPTVVVVTTGGTIAMQPDADAGGAVPALSGEALVAAVPELAKLASIRVIPVCNIDSREMQPELWLKLAKTVNRVVAEPSVTGVVVTHGTDTMEESAFLLHCVVGSDKPVVLTGAQRDATARDADGPRNLLNAVRQVLDARARGRGVTVTLNGRILGARAVEKSHTVNVEAFGAGAYGQLGQIDDQGVLWFHRPEPRSVQPLPDAFPRVDLVYCYPGADGRLIDAAVRAGARGVVVAGYGVGNVSRPMFDAIVRARDAGVAVVLATRVPSGRVYPVYGGAGGGASMRAQGVVFAGDLAPHKARIVLMLALARSSDPPTLQATFDG